MSIWVVASRRASCLRACALGAMTKSARWYSTPSGPVDLAFDKAEPSAAEGSSRPIVILHGLFGHKQNWRSLSRAMAKNFKTSVYALDLRNHGASPHNQDMRYESLASDVLHFLKRHSLSNIVLIGHSMGGKTASALALKPDLPQNTLSSLVIADITPEKGALSSEFVHYTNAMKAIEDARVKDSKAAYKILEEYPGIEIELPVQQFLLTNLHTVDGVRKFRIPLDIIASHLHETGDFPYEPGEASWDGPTLVVRGLRSNFIKEKNIPIIRQLFPNVEIASLDASHWVHSERPAEFLKLIGDFIAKHK